MPTVTEGNQAQSEATLVQLADPLDEPEFYCVDVPGFGASLNLQAALMAHTCKPGADDEIFTVGQPGPGNLSMPAYKLCMEAEGAETQAPLRLQECSDSALQQFDFDADGALILSGTGLCVAVSPEDGEPTGGPKPRAPRSSAAGLRRGPTRPEPMGLPRHLAAMTAPVIPRAALSRNPGRTPE